MKKRQYLEPKQTIDLRIRNDSADFKRTFTIGEKISEGAFAVCYDACYAGSGHGVLKEFYPEEAYLLERDASRQLVMTEGLHEEQEKFLEEEAAYLKPYEMLLDLKRNGKDQDLATFIPTFEIYQGCDREGNLIGSVYVWTPEPKLETFDKICDDIHKNPEKDPEEKLVLVLNAIKSLTECICILHGEGIIHRDIKPSNFGFKKRGGQVLYQTIALIDVNSICSVYSKEKDLVETKGYLEPEGKIKEVTNQTDIYAIGVTLFNAIVVTDETRGNDYVYQPEEYDRLYELVRDSRLIHPSESNSNPRLVTILTKILHDSLCGRKSRYDNCEQMLKDLEEALFYALPTNIALKQQAGQKWVLRDVEKSFDAEREKNSSLATCCHLYEHPLYQCVREEDPVIDVLIIGFGNYGQKFMDVCLQVGQIRDKGLHVIVLSDYEKDKEIYLKDRPVLPEFFNIDGSLDRQLKAGELSGQDVYGDIEFRTRQLERDNPQKNAKLLKKIMDAYQAKGQQPNYVYIALGDDALNLAAASACKEAVDAYGWDCLVNYVCENEKSRRNPSPAENVIPLYINEKVKEMTLYPQLERMAFNTHLVWEKDLDIDYKAVRQEFEIPYNRNSSVASVLSIKYKLHSVGIDMESGGYNTKAAEEFQALLEDPANGEMKNELVWVEHRRWVTEKLCQGWRKKEAFDCVDGLTRDEENKEHVCLVRSRPESGLETAWDQDRWDDTHNPAALQELDELDCMSVQLHRAYVNKAKTMKEQGPISEEDGNLAEIRSLIEGNGPATAAYQAWLACVRDIWNGDTQKVNLYEGFKVSFLTAAEGLTKENRQALALQVQVFDLEFRPILESMRYRDFRQDDVALVEQIPFILTYDENLHMVIPYTLGNSTDLFSNVAAATVVNPKKITYLCFLSGRKDLKALSDSVPGVLEYMAKKKIRSRIHFLLYCEEDMEPRDLKEQFQQKTGCRDTDIQCVTGADKKELQGKLQALFTQKGSREIVPLVIEKNRSGFSYYLEGAGFYEQFPCYQFDARTMQFTSLKDCDLLEYIHKKPYMTVDEMLALSGAHSLEWKQPEFYADYKKLWKRYCQDKQAWKSLCHTFENYAEKKDPLVSIPVADEADKKKGAYYEYRLPFACRKNAAMILEFMKEQDAISGYGVHSFTSDSCRVSINGPQGYKEGFDTLFSNVTALMIPDAVTVYKKKGEILVEFDNLSVTEASVSGSDKDLQKRILDLAEYLYENGYLINLKNEEGTLSFTYATRQVKELLTTEGKMLEVYVYHKVKEQDGFDDVASGYEFSWKEKEVRNEWDCIITKGFQTLIVECKARPKLDQEFYYKLSTLASRIGVNAKAVVVADTGQPADKDLAKENAIQRKRGMECGITTVWKGKDIENIGETLLKVMDGSFSGDGK